MIIFILILCFDILCIGVQNQHTHIPREVIFNTYTPQNESFLVIINFTSQNTTSTNVACEMTGEVFLILFTDLPNQIKMQNFMQYKPIIGSKKGLRNLFQI